MIVSITSSLYSFSTQISISPSDHLHDLVAKTDQEVYPLLCQGEVEMPSSSSFVHAGAIVLWGAGSPALGPVGGRSPVLLLQTSRAFLLQLGRVRKSHVAQDGSEHGGGDLKREHRRMDKCWFFSRSKFISDLKYFEIIRQILFTAFCRHNIAAMVCCNQSCNKHAPV